MTNELMGLMSWAFLAIFRVIFSLLYRAWIFTIYIMALTLTTFWVQDIFDELIHIKLVRAIE
jgi:hypothetical protein